MSKIITINVNPKLTVTLATIHLYISNSGFTHELWILTKVIVDLHISNPRSILRQFWICTVENVDLNVSYQYPDPDLPVILDSHIGEHCLRELNLRAQSKVKVNKTSSRAHCPSVEVCNNLTSQPGTPPENSPNLNVSILSSELRQSPSIKHHIPSSHIGLVLILHLGTNSLNTNTAISRKQDPPSHKTGADPGGAPGARAPPPDHQK